MKSIATKGYHILTSRTIFTYIYILISVLWFFPILGTYVDLISKICFIWGAGLIAWNTFVQGKLLKGPQALLRVLMLLAYGITILLNFKFTLYMGIKHLIYNGINLLIIYVLDTEKSEKNNKKLLYLVDETLICIATVSSIISLVMFIFLISFQFKQDYIVFRQGFVSNRLYGVFTSPNTGALFMLISWAAMMINSAIKHGKPMKWKIWYCLAAVPQFLYFALSISRGGSLTAFALIIMVSVTYLLPKWYQRWKKAMRACILSALSILVCSVAFYGATELIRSGMAFVPSLVRHAVQSTTDDKKPGKIHPTLPNIRFERDDEEVSNGRFTIWKAGLAAWKQAPIFGIADADVYHGGNTINSKISASLLTKLNQNELKRSQGNMHNTYVQVLVYSGVVGFILFAALAIAILAQYLRFLIFEKKDGLYPVIAIMFSLIAAMAVNGLVETHILFNRQDPYGVLFWFFTGMGLLLVKLHMREERQSRGGAEVFICDTPYQLINALALAQTHRSEACLMDMYIYDQFKDADTVSAALRDLQIFDHVYLFRRYRHHTGLLSKLTTLIRMHVPYYMLKSHCQSKLSSAEYDRIYMAYITPFIDSVKLMNPQAEVYEYEDGIGSYYIENLEDFSRSKFFKFWSRRLFGNALSYNASALYLHQPTAYTGKTYEHIRPLPIDMEGETLRKIFHYQNNEQYHLARFIYLTQPLDEKIGERAKEVERQLLKKTADKVLVRVHPRQDKTDYQSYTVDTADNLWELECAGQITAEHVLIGAFSTAQFTPKMLFDIEPTVVFLYRLFDDAFNNADAMVDTLKQMYRNPEKIMVADSVEQLMIILQELENR